MFACSRAGSPNLRSARSFGTGPSISPVGLEAAEGLSVIARGWTSNVRAPCDAGSSTAAKKDCVLPYRMPFTPTFSNLWSGTEKRPMQAYRQSVRLWISVTYSNSYS
ncbi:unnamed protein product [Nesidiocoris tenuis]|uniref:Uncharacterized protein n=1 Tax=Nesidiocoris tenuis TaxID=355587 RepID=A0A6H5HPX3_9HEMI|nr:unnamed protein product [Nesidiocoris tenuis]